MSHPLLYISVFFIANLNFIISASANSS